MCKSYKVIISVIHLTLLCNKNDVQNSKIDMIYPSLKLIRNMSASLPFSNVNHHGMEWYSATRGFIVSRIADIFYRYMAKLRFNLVLLLMLRLVFELAFLFFNINDPVECPLPF